jgi:hypothetical protein
MIDAVMPPMWAPLWILHGEAIKAAQAAEAAAAADVAEAFAG